MGNIIQYGLGRTGSTLIYRILKEIVGDVQKAHPPFTNKYGESKLIVSVRHPIDSFLSYVRVNEFPSSETDVIKISAQHINNHLPIRLRQENELITLYNTHKDKALFLKYEFFLDDFDFIFDKLENYLQVKLDSAKRQMIYKKCNLLSAKKIQKGLKSFAEYDKLSQIHGNHIVSPHLHECYQYVENPETITELEKIFTESIAQWRTLK